MSDDQEPWRPYAGSLYQGVDQETQPILDMGKSSQAHVDEDVLDQHRNVYTGIPPLGMHKYYKHKRKSERNRSKRAFKNEENKAEKTVLPPNEQVQFILGTEKHGAVEDLLRPGETPCLFTEMLQLKQIDGESIWRETCRWVKFEECVEEGGDRWSKPHVSSLSLHNLFELRSCIFNGVVQLDMAASDMVQITDLLVERLVSQGHLPEDDDVTDRIRAVLLSEHEHQGERKKGVTAIRSVTDFMARRDSDSRLKQHGLNRQNTNSSFNRPKSLGSSPSSPSNVGSSFVDPDKKSKVPYFMKKIPQGAEAGNILVGEVDFLQQRIAAFIRLQDSTVVERLTEVPIPTRFVFLLLGPPGNYKQYHQIGRSIATLLCDEIFREVAYKSKTRKDLVAGIDEFLDQVTVLPPGEWDASTRIKPPKDLPGNQKQRLVGNESFKEKVDKKEDITRHPVSAELQRTGRLFGGLINDIKRKAPHYASDFKDCLSIQCFASFIFLYFAILTPIVTFGGLLGDATHNYLGTMESIFGGAMSGTIYHLCSGQPLTIIGSTGPILVFEKIMYELCTILGLKYISFRVWVGCWTGVMCLGLVAFDASSLISFVTRYTEESFSALISFIFIFEAFKKLMHEGGKLKIWYGWNPDLVTQYECECLPPDLSNVSITYNITYEEMKQASKDLIAASHQQFHKGILYRMDNDSYICAFHDSVRNVTNVSDISWDALNKTACMSYYCGELYGNSCAFTPDAVFMSIILFFGTFSISMALKGLKTSRYFPTKVRTIVSDFAVTIAIALMVAFDLVMDISTSKLTVPHSFRPTREDREWLIDPFDENPWWSAILAIVPAFLATILIFMDQQITAVIVNRKENKLKKGCGYHLDLFIVSIMLITCSILGLPWFVAATVLSITHVNSLRMESETSAPGESAKFLGVREQRVTGILIFLMIGVSVFLTPILAHIPMAVLYGVFLYMGVSSLRGVQFFDRIKLFFMPPKHQPDFVYLRHVPLPKVHLFTAIQVLGFAILWFIKSTKPISIIFPMMVAALVGVRKVFDYCLFTQQELLWLDDIIPEFTKKKKEDAKKKKEEEETKMAMQDNVTVDVPLQDGKVLRIPVSQLKYNTDTPTGVNISKEVSETAIWKTLSSNEMESYNELRNRPGNSLRERNTDNQNHPTRTNGYQTAELDSRVDTTFAGIKLPDDETTI